MLTHTQTEPYKDSGAIIHGSDPDRLKLLFRNWRGLAERGRLPTTIEGLCDGNSRVFYEEMFTQDTKALR